MKHIWLSSELTLADRILKLMSNTMLCMLILQFTAVPFLVLSYTVTHMYTYNMNMTQYDKQFDTERVNLKFQICSSQNPQNKNCIFKFNLKQLWNETVLQKKRQNKKWATKTTYKARMV